MSLKEGEKEERENLRKSLEHALLNRGQGIEAVACLIGNVALQCGVTLPSHAKLEEGKPLLNEEECKSIIRDVQKTDSVVGTELQNIYQASRKKRSKHTDLDSIISAIEVLKTCGRCYLRVPEMSRKREKHLLHLMKKSMYSEMSADLKCTKEERASRILRLVLLHAKDSIALPPTDFNITCLCYRIVRSLDDETKIWGSSRSGSICSSLDVLEKAGVFNDDEVAGDDDDNDDSDLSLLLSTLLTK